MLCANLAAGYVGATSGGATTSVIYAFNPAGMTFPGLSVGCPANTFSAWAATDVTYLNTKLNTLTTDLAAAVTKANDAKVIAETVQASFVSQQQITVANLSNMGITPESVLIFFAFGFSAVWLTWAAGFGIGAALKVIRKI